MEIYAETPIDWKEHSDIDHPEETKRAKLVQLYEHDTGAKLFLWDSREGDKLWKTDQYTIELRDSRGKVLYKKDYDNTQKYDINYTIETQMEIYPTQKLW